jgi:uncharacterized protein (DUF1697 family)
VTTYVALLRGVNVGGHRRVPMDTLRRVVESIGHGDVLTYIASGNVVFESPDRPTRTLAAEIELRVLEAFGFEVDVAVRSAAELSTVVAGNPFLDSGAAPKALYVAFARDPVAGAERSIDRSYLPDEFSLDRFVIYLHRPDGFGRTTKLTDAFLAHLAGSPVTTRNWNTVTKLAELADR